MQTVELIQSHLQDMLIRIGMFEEHGNHEYATALAEEYEDWFYVFLNEEGEYNVLKSKAL